MLKNRVIPILQLNNGDLVKTINFKKYFYLGDPINSVRIFNEKEVDELVFLDISRDRFQRGPDFNLLQNIASEAFMPFSYGGGISKIEEIRDLMNLGIEKVIISSYAIENINFISEAVELVGSSSLVVSLDINIDRFGKHYITNFSGTNKVRLDLFNYVQELVRNGAGEILINCIHRDGMMNGYDLEILKEISSLISLPIIIAGGAGNLLHLKEAIQAGASAVGGGSFFVLYGKHKAFLISYPSLEELNSLYI